MPSLLKWLVWAFGVVVGLIAVVIAVGYALPVAHTASVESVVPGSVDEVWLAITDVEAMPSWRPGVDRTDRLPDRAGLPVWTESGPTGSMTLQVLELDRPRRMVTRIADEDLPFGGTWTYELEAVEGGTRVRLTEDGEIYSPFFRFVSRFILGYDATMRAYLMGLESRMRAEVDPGSDA